MEGVSGTGKEPEAQMGKEERKEDSECGKKKEREHINVDQSCRLR